MGNDASKAKSRGFGPASRTSRTNNLRVFPALQAERHSLCKRLSKYFAEVLNMCGCKCRQCQTARRFLFQCATAHWYGRRNSAARRRQWKGGCIAGPFSNCPCSSVTWRWFRCARCKCSAVFHLAAPKWQQPESAGVMKLISAWLRLLQPMPTCMRERLPFPFWDSLDAPSSRRSPDGHPCMQPRMATNPQRTQRVAPR